jgi:hypothetical protein
MKPYAIQYLSRKMPAPKAFQLCGIEMRGGIRRVIP